MSAEIQVELTKKIIRDWARGDDCSGVDALVAIIEILDFDPYTWELNPAVAHEARAGD